MSNRKKAFIFILLIIAAVPLSVSAGWFWNKPAAKTNAPVEIVLPAELSTAGKEVADAKYKILEESFEKKNVDSVIANQDSFWFTAPELNYLFVDKSANAKKPLISNFHLNNENDSLKISATFNKIIKGKISFNAEIEQENNKVRLNLSKTRLAGFPIPGSWLSKPLNNALDEYLSFLYNDNRYQGFTFSNSNGVIKIHPEFK